MPVKRSPRGALALCAAGLIALGMNGRVSWGAGPRPQIAARQIIVPGEDRFRPFAVTIHLGQSVQWINMDTDVHAVVSNDFFVTSDNKGTNKLLPGNGGTLTLTFNKPGVFPFYCKFHAVLDKDFQPKAPGPNGGIQDPNGNYGTPMNGVITVLPTRAGN